MSYRIQFDSEPCPGETIRETIEELNISQKELAARTGLTAKTVSQLINGKAPITPNIADKLEYVTGVPCVIWLNLENNYRLFLKQQKAQEKANLEEAREFASQFPYADLVKQGVCPATRNAAERKDALLRFFAVSDTMAYQKTYISPIEGAARVGFSKCWNAHAFASWLRLAEIKAQKISTDEFTPDKLETAVREIRKYVVADISSVWEKVQDILATAGVAAVVEPELKECHIFGFSRFIEPQKALLVLSLRGKRVGSFWFNLFHELCHLLKHSKKKTFYNFDCQTHGKHAEAADDEEEAEADKYSRDTLIAPIAWNGFIGGRRAFTASSIRSFASAQQVPTDVILGRLQREKLVHYSNPMVRNCMQTVTPWA